MKKQVTNKKKQKNFVPLTVLWTLPVLAGCAVGPNYKRPAPTPTPAPLGFKEIKDWKPADPATLPDQGRWWELYNDPTLNQLESQVRINNQNVAEAAANYRASEALVTEARAGLFPVLNATFDASRGQQGSAGLTGTNNSSFATGQTGPRNQFSPELSASWTADIWGEVRREIAEAKQNAAVSQEDLAYATLSAQATLASDYFQLRSTDSLRTLLTETVDGDARALTITKNEYNAGTVTSADVVTAQAQLEAAQAQLAGVAGSRAIYEHAIAVQLGAAPAALTLAAAPLTKDVPVVPAGLPSELLERRPDIAAAESGMHSKSEAIGVAEAALYPTITLTASGGFSGNALNNLFSVANRVWSLGAAADLNIFDGGAQTAAITDARANYDNAVATYRETVLTAFQGVEDELATLNAAQNEAVLNDAAVQAAQKAVDVMLNQYKAGTVAYTSVITEQNLLLADQQSQLTNQTNRLLASVTLIEDIGGGWKKIAPVRF